MRCRCIRGCGAASACAGLGGSGSYVPNSGPTRARHPLRRRRPVRIKANRRSRHDPDAGDCPQLCARPRVEPGSSYSGRTLGPARRLPPSSWRPLGATEGPHLVRMRLVTRVELRAPARDFARDRTATPPQSCRPHSNGLTLHATARFTSPKGATASCVPTTRATAPKILPGATREPRSLSVAIGGAAACLCLGRRPADRYAASAPSAASPQLLTYLARVSRTNM
jgi:hypothetical protein